jgi:hypothetical protein
MLKSSCIKLILFLSVLLASGASAEVYTWEEGNVIHFTDNPSEAQARLSVEAAPENSDQNINVTPVADIGEVQHSRSVAIQKKQTEVYRGTPEQQRPATTMIVQQLPTATTEHARITKETFPSLATLIVAWLLLALILLVIWIGTMRDIVKSAFITPAIKMTWMLLVLLLPFIGMVFYYILGSSQKCSLASNNDKQLYSA